MAADSTEFTYRVTEKPDEVSISIGGTLDEASEMPVPEVRGRRVIIDAKGVARVNSMGVRAWVEMMTELSARTRDIVVMQVPAVLVTLPVIAYVLATEATTPAIIFSIWTIIAGLSDNLLKPLMLGRGLEVPMPVILIGVIGGMLADGLLGLFVGPVLLAVGYALLMEWLRYDPIEGRPQTDNPLP